ncbi:MAG: hypothetical protein IPO92_10145 [Saprospiraceae bacterium]|nr:hypothetical protein [Saprospiraceae bacterium]
MSEIKYFFKSYPTRLKRLAIHISYPFYRSVTNDFPPANIPEWFGDVVFYLMDTLAIPELHLFICSIFKWNIRKLTKHEESLAKSVFGQTIDFDLVRIDAKARLGTKKMAHAYVSFNIINYMKEIKHEILIHEMVHIWQYQHFGCIYIARAIKAQRSKEGYDYGGIANLYKVMLRGGSLLEFNFEQQADIIEDYFRICLTHSDTAPMNKTIYNYFVAQLREKSKPF